MSFAKKIEKLQRKPVHERKMVALFATSIVFVVIMLLLYAGGAFSFGSISFIPKDPSALISAKEDISALVETTSEEFRSVVASSSAMIKEIRELASTTATGTDSVGRCPFGTIDDSDVASTSSSEECATSTDPVPENPVSEEGIDEGIIH